MARAYLSIGSNLGCKEENLCKAIKALEQTAGRLLKCSDFIETKPWGFTSANSFLNAALSIETDLNPEQLLAETQRIERQIGRTKKSVNGTYSDRPIDIDILFFDDFIVENDHLVIPHPLLHVREFVMEPLHQIAPQFVHPKLNKTVEQLYKELCRNNAKSELP